MRLKEFLSRAAQGTSDNALVLDAGAGEGFYRPLFRHARYHAADFGKVEKTYGQLSYICDLANIPVSNAAYDVIICTQVLEHLPDPQRVLSEFQRILKPSGQLWFSAPLFFFEHEVPYDYYRYTRYGLKYLLEEAGFTVQELSWLEGYYATFAYQIRLAAKSLPLSPRAYENRGLWFILFPLFVLLKPFFYALSLLFHFLETQSKFTYPEAGKNFCGVAVKPAAHSSRRDDESLLIKSNQLPG